MKHMKHMKQIIKIISLSICLLSLSAMSEISYANAAFAVSPRVVSIDVNKPHTQVFIVRNTGDQLIHLQIKPIFMPLASNSLKGGQTMIQGHEDKTSLVPFMMVSPQALSLQPGEQRDVRVSVRTPANLPNGTYRSHLLFHMLEVASVGKAGQANKSSLGVALNMMMEVAVGIYGQKGQGNPELGMRCAVNNKNQLNLDFINNTPWHYSAAIDVDSSEGKKAKMIMPIFRQSQRDVLVADVGPVKAGEKFAINWHDDNKKGIKGSTTCTIQG